MAAPVGRLSLRQRGKESGEGRMRVASVRPRTAGVMKTLMRNGRDRRSENPLLGHAKIERVLLIGTDQRITSGPAAKRPHPKAEYMTAPERFADGQIPLAPRAPSIHDPLQTSAARFCCDAQHTPHLTMC